MHASIHKAEGFTSDLLPRGWLVSSNDGVDLGHIGDDPGMDGDSNCND